MFHIVEYRDKRKCTNILILGEGIIMTIKNFFVCVCSVFNVVDLVILVTMRSVYASHSKMYVEMRRVKV